MSEDEFTLADLRPVIEEMRRDVQRLAEAYARPARPLYHAAEDIHEGTPLDLRDGKAWAITEDDVKGAGARFYPERLTCSKGDPVEYVHIAEHNPERDAGRLICGVHEYGRGDNLAVPCGPNGPFAHFAKGPGLRVVHHYVQGAGSIADCGRGFTGSGPEVGFTDDWSAVTCPACRQVYDEYAKKPKLGMLDPDTKADPTPPVTFDIVSGPIVHAVMYRDHQLGTLCQSGAYGNPELYTAVTEHVTCPACREKLEGNRAAESTENRGSNPR